EVTSEPQAGRFRDLISNDPAKSAAADKLISEDPLLHAIMRNTIAPVLMNAGFRGNVIPGSAEATVNFRIIPGSAPEELVREVQGVIEDPKVEVVISTLTNGGVPETPEIQRATEAARKAPPSPQENELYRALARNAAAV